MWTRSFARGCKTARISHLAGLGLEKWGMNFGEYRLADLLNSLFGVFPQEIEGDAALRRKRVGGDFIVREGESPAKLAARLEVILRQECKLPMRVTFRDVERKVIVAK